MHIHRQIFSVLLLFTLGLGIHSLGTGLDVLLTKAEQSPPPPALLRNVCVGNAMASQEKSGSAQSKAKSTDSAAADTDLEGDHSSEQEQTGQYPVVQDFCALLFALILFFSVYGIIRRKAMHSSGNRESSR